MIKIILLCVVVPAIITSHRRHPLKRLNLNRLLCIQFLRGHLLGLIFRLLFHVYHLFRILRLCHFWHYLLHLLLLFILTHRVLEMILLARLFCVNLWDYFWNWEVIVQFYWLRFVLGDHADIARLLDIFEVLVNYIIFRRNCLLRCTLVHTQFGVCFLMPWIWFCTDIIRISLGILTELLLYRFL